MSLLDRTPALFIDVTHDAETTTASLRGELDVATAPRLGQVISGVLEAGHVEVVLDLDELDFCDSTGLGAMLRLHRSFEDAGGHLVLSHPSHIIKRILQITALDQTLHVAS